MSWTLRTRRMLATAVAVLAFGAVACETDDVAPGEPDPVEPEADADTDDGAY